MPSEISISGSKLLVSNYILGSYASVGQTVQQIPWPPSSLMAQSVPDTTQLIDPVTLPQPQQELRVRSGVGNSHSVFGVLPAWSRGPWCSSEYAGGFLSPEVRCVWSSVVVNDITDLLLLLALHASNLLSLSPVWNRQKRNPFLQMILPSTRVCLHACSL